MKITSFCTGWVSIYVLPFFYRSLKLRYPLDVRGVSREGRITTELGTGSLRHAPKSIVNKVSGFDGSKPYHFKCEGTEGSKLEARLLSVNVTAVQETHFTCAADCRVLEND